MAAQHPSRVDSGVPLFPVSKNCLFAWYLARCSAELGMLNLDPQSSLRIEKRLQLLVRGSRQERGRVQQPSLDVGRGELRQMFAQVKVVCFRLGHQVEVD